MERRLPLDPGASADFRFPAAFGGPSDIPPPHSAASEHVEAMVAAWRRGERPGVEEYLARHPGLDGEAAVRLIFEEFSLRQEVGLPADPVEFARRFPRWRTELEVLLDCQRLMQPAPAPHAFPVPGEDLAGFRLLAELGRGALGRVYLASQFALADRPVVLKVTPIGREEHLSLARLQHMNIVPLYSAQVLPGRGLQVLCMPFLGGGSLAEVLDRLKGQDPARRTGGGLLDALDRVQGRLPAAVPARGPFREYLAGLSYVEAIGWVGVCLADGLQYAHDRDFVHMDIKPSNVLLAGDGQPMLLDFHLARGPLAQGDPAPGRLGGTPGSMAPEQLAAINAVIEGRPIPAPVDGRADVYSLGALLHEALGGAEPGPADGPRPPIRRLNPRVPLGLSDILDRCLEADPGDRYPTAAALAADLRRFLDGLPLRGVPNRSPAERWRNWRRRRPHALSRGLILMVAAVLAISASALLRASYLQRVREVEGALAEGRAHLDHHRYPEASKAFRRALAVAESVPVIGNRRPVLFDGLDRARRGARAEELHRFADLVRFRYGVDPPPPEEADALIRRGRALWQDRGWLMTTEADAGVRADLLDLALAWASVRVRSASPAEADGARREARRMLDEAEALLGPVAAIARDRRDYEADPGRPDAAPDATLAAVTASEHAELGKSFLRAGEIPRAAEQFRLGLTLRPEDFWLNFYQGTCDYRLGRFRDAVNDFRVCVAIAPDSAECSFNGAKAHAALGEADEAIADYTRALRLNPTLTAAAINRGLLHYQAGRLAEASADLHRALASASGRGDRGVIRYDLALVDLARGDRPAALENLRIAAGDGHEAARLLRDRLP